MTQGDFKMKSFGAVITYNGRDCDGHNSDAGKVFVEKSYRKAVRNSLSYNKASDGIICNVRSFRDVINSRKEDKKRATDCYPYTPVNEERKDFRLYERFEKSDHGFRYFSEFKASIGQKPFRN